MKKIKVSSVNMTSDVQVIFINASLITKAVRASIAAKRISDEMEMCSTVRNVTKDKIDEDGNLVKDENGSTIQEQVLDENNKPVREYSSHRLDGIDTEAFYEDIAPFIQELVDAFEEA